MLLEGQKRIIHFTWKKNKVLVDAFMVYNNELSFNQLSPSESAKDFIYALDTNGNPYAPSWYTLNLRAQYQYNDKLSLTASLENITDQRYRPYSLDKVTFATYVVLLSIDKS